ncbi:hypothetical protein HPK02_10295 [Anoxybacillus flavithermus]|uniref:hypothetical protein n=1 Tax=Anoxybacillus flavithermus TaxID=33934 RepID=UPI0012FC8D95|nr:hypothetical protein [Anoxybacillus flavithermus]MBE2919258.1 hypothetical protein [Anoxybacillus flavithermus]
MNKLLKSRLEKKYFPKTTKEKSMRKIISNPENYGKFLAEQAIKKININLSNS